MDICLEKHAEVCYDGHNCPVCEMRDDLNEDILALTEELKDITEERNDFENQTDQLERQVARLEEDRL